MIGSVFAGSVVLSGTAAASSNFLVSSVTLPNGGTVDNGQTVNVEAEITNGGTSNDTQTVNLTFRGTVVASKSVTLGAGNSTNVTFSLDLNDTPVGSASSLELLASKDYNTTVSTENDTRTKKLTVQSSASLTVNNQTTNGTQITISSYDAGEFGTNISVWELYQSNRTPTGDNLGTVQVNPESTGSGVTIQLSTEFNTTQFVGIAIHNGSAYTLTNLLVKVGVPPGDGRTITPAEVSFTSDVSSGSSVTVDSATLGDGGFVVIHKNNSGSPGAIVGSSSYLSPGAHQNIGVFLDEEFNTTTDLIAMLHRDDGDQSFNKTNDNPYKIDGSPVTDKGTLTPAEVTFLGQVSAGKNVTVADASLGDGGFIAIHKVNETTGAIQGIIGSSAYLSPGRAQDVLVELDNPISQSQTLAAMLHRDEDGNQSFDASVDGPYMIEGSAVTDGAAITYDGVAPKVTITVPTETKLRKRGDTLRVEVEVNEDNIDGNATVKLTGSEIQYSVPIVNGTNSFELLLNTSQNATASSSGVYAPNTSASTGSFDTGDVFNLSVTVKDKVGRSTTDTEANALAIDNTPPGEFALVSPAQKREYVPEDDGDVVGFDDIQIAYLYNESNTDSVTVTLNGSTTTGDVISTTVNDSQYLDDGVLKSFELDLFESFGTADDYALADGAYNVTVTVTDEAGNTFKATSSRLVYINNNDVDPNFLSRDVRTNVTGTNVTVFADYNVSVPEDAGDLSGDSLERVMLEVDDRLFVRWYDESEDRYRTEYLYASNLFGFDKVRISNNSPVENVATTDSITRNLSKRLATVTDPEDRILNANYRTEYNSTGFTAYDTDSSVSYSAPSTSSKTVIDQSAKRPTIEFVEVVGPDTSDQLMIHFSRPVFASDSEISADDFAYQAINNSTGATIITEVIQRTDYSYGYNTIIVQLDHEVAAEDVGRDLVSVAENALYNPQTNLFVSAKETTPLQESDPPAIHDVQVQNNASRVLVEFDQIVQAGGGGDLTAANVTYNDTNAAGASAVVSVNQTGPTTVMLTLDAPATSDDVDKDVIEVSAGEVYDRFGNTQADAMGLDETIAPNGIEIVRPANRTIKQSNETLKFGYRYTENIPNGTNFVKITLENSDGQTYTYYVNESQYVDDGVLKTITLDLDRMDFRDDGRFYGAPLVDEQYTITIQATDDQGNTHSVTTEERLIINDLGPEISKVDATPEDDVAPGEEINVTFQVQDAANVTQGKITILQEGQIVQRKRFNLSIASPEIRTRNVSTNVSGDIVFLVDDSGSMSDEIATVRDNIGTFADRISTRNGSIRFAVVTFADGVQVRQRFTTDPQDVKNALANIVASGANERNYDAIGGTLDGSLLGERADNNTIIIDLTDEGDEPTAPGDTSAQDFLANEMSQRDVKYIAVSPDEFAYGDPAAAQKKELAEKTQNAAWFNIQNFTAELLLNEIAAEAAGITLRPTVTKSINISESIEDNSDYTIRVMATDESGFGGSSTVFEELDVNAEQPHIERVETNTGQNTVRVIFNEPVVALDGEFSPDDFSYQDVSASGPAMIDAVLSTSGSGDVPFYFASATEVVLKVDEDVNVSDLDTDLIAARDDVFVDTDLFDVPNARPVSARLAVPLDDTTPPDVGVTDRVINAANDESYTVGVDVDPRSELLDKRVVTVSDGQTSVSKVVPAGQTSVTLNVSTLDDGPVNVTATATDVANNTGTTTVTVPKDTVSAELLSAEVDATTDVVEVTVTEPLDLTSLNQLVVSSSVHEVADLLDTFPDNNGNIVYVVRLNRTVPPSAIGNVTVSSTAPDQAGNPTVGSPALSDNEGPVIEAATSTPGDDTVLVQVDEDVANPGGLTASDFVYGDVTGSGATGVSGVQTVDDRTFLVTLNTNLTAADLNASETIALASSVTDTRGNAAPGVGAVIVAADQVPDLQTEVNGDTVTVRVVTSNSLSSALSGNVTLTERNREFASPEGFELEDRFEAAFDASDFTQVAAGVYETTVTVGEDGVYDAEAVLNGRELKASALVNQVAPRPTDAVILSVTEDAQPFGGRNTTRIRVLFNEPIHASGLVSDATGISPSDIDIEGLSSDAKVIAVQHAGPFGAVEIIVEGKVQTAGGPNVTIDGKSYVDYAGTPGQPGGKTVLHTDILELQAGANFVSVPAASGDLPLSEIDTSNVDAVFAYNATTDSFEAYDPAAPQNDFNTLEGGKGYIFMMDAGDDIAVNVANVPMGQSPPNAQDLEEGYNLVGHYQEDSQKVPVAFSSVVRSDERFTDTVFRVLRQAEGSNGFQYESYRAGDFETLERGQAYWVFVTDDETYTEAPFDRPQLSDST